jgi:hypothetical protein
MQGNCSKFHYSSTKEQKAGEIQGKTADRSQIEIKPKQKNAREEIRKTQGSYLHRPHTLEAATRTQVCC